MSAQLSTSKDSSETLPITGYTVDQLREYVKRQLGYPTWNVELTNQQIQDCIQDALGIYSQWVPLVKVGNVSLQRNNFEYLKDADVGFGIAEIHFVEPNPVPTEMFYGNLINPAPIFRTGLDELDGFLRWRKVWQRITSVKPDWFYDESRRVLYIHNPIERYQCAVFTYNVYPDTCRLPHSGAQWVKEYALEASRYLYGEVLSKFSGAIPGPLKDIQLDTQKRDKAEARLEKLRETVKGMQASPAISID